MSDMQLNNEKGCLFKGKTTKSFTTFRTNKPNSPIVRTDVTSLKSMNYTIFISLTKVKNKPNQTQYKANSNPIPESPKMNVNIYYTKAYNNETASGSGKNKPNTNPNKAKLTNLSTRDNKSSIYPRGLIDVPLCFYALMFLALFPRSLSHYSLDYMARWAVEYLCCMSLVKNKCNSHIRRNQNAD